MLALGSRDAKSVTVDDVTADVLHITAPSAELAARYLGDAKQAFYLIRPDQHMVARWGEIDLKTVQAALKRALAKD